MSEPTQLLLPAVMMPATYRRQLVAAGITDSNAQTTFLAMHALAIGVGALAAVWLVLGKNPSIATWFPAAFVGAMAGWWIPRSWLEWKQTQRRIEIVTDFPVMLDLLQISLQGGMGLPAAWDVVASTLAGTGDAMAQEMRRIDFEISFGTPWGQSLHAASERTGVPEFRSLGSLLQQTERFGTELSRMIQVLSDSLRNEEIESLEERAHRASVLMLLPIGVLLLPATLLLIAVPLITMLFETLNEVNSN
ncbi:MAG: type II secretion system F family protein [Planctomycetota bacterium]